MTLTPEIHREPADRAPGWALLVLGAVGILLGGPRWGIAAVAWLAPVPFLLFVRRAVGRRAWLGLFGVLLGAHAFQLIEIVVPQPAPIAVIAFGLPLATARFVALGGAEILRRRVGERAGVLGFASLVAVTDWALYRHTELSAWSTTANTQVTVDPVIQLAALCGLAGVSFLVAWLAASVARVLGAPRPGRRWAILLAPLIALVAALQYGSARLDSSHGGRAVTVAAVVTDLGMVGGLPDAATLTANTDQLFERTALASRRGARLVVWNEAATLVEVDGEAALVQRARHEARALDVDIVLAYAVILGRAPLALDNKLAFVTSAGEVVETYRKHHPVPGEPSLRGTEPLHAIDRPYGRVGVAICYDYDFPEMALEHAALGIELVAVPSSDWRGIDPVHTQMARTRAIEGGFSVVRSTRWAASAAFDAYGRVRSWMPVTEANDRVMVASVPVGRIATLYARIGDTAVAFAGAWLALGFALALRGRLRPPDQGAGT